FSEGAERRGMRVANGYGLALLSRIFCGKIQLTADGADFLNVIEKGNVAEGASDAGRLRGFVGDRGGGGAAVYEEKSTCAKQRHEFSHELWIASGTRALMIVHSRGVRHGAQHRTQDVRDF